MNNYVILNNADTKIVISDNVWSVWNKYRQSSFFKKEACGVLIGGYDAESHSIFIEQCTEPMNKDRRFRSSFTLKDPGHQKTVDIAFDNSGGQSFYLGTWHTHPEHHPSPSPLDQKDWNACMKRNPEIPYFVFAIVGTGIVTLFPGTNKRITN